MLEMSAWGSFQPFTTKQNGDCSYKVIPPPKAVDWLVVCCTISCARQVVITLLPLVGSNVLLKGVDYSNCSFHCKILIPLNPSGNLVVFSYFMRNSDSN